jgi:hypothetical protein
LVGGNLESGAVDAAVGGGSWVMVLQGLETQGGRVHLRQVPGGEGALLALPGLDQPGDHPRGQPRAGAQELPERGCESLVDSPCRYGSGNTSVTFGVLQHQGGRIAEENRIRSPVSGSVRPSLTRGVSAYDHLHRPGAGEHLARLMRAVAHHQPPPALVTLVGELGDLGVDLGRQRLGHHPPGTLAHDLIDQRRASDRTRLCGAVVAAIGLVRHYGEHGAYLPDRRWRAGLA